MFKATILTSQRVLYDDKAWSVFLPGAAGEFEVLEFHKDIVSRLKGGNIVIDWNKKIPIAGGIMRMRDDEFVAVVEERVG
ncbi:MAG: hypothetical protein V1927_02615 [Candidatus Omnitrophota bacterium]